VCVLEHLFDRNFISHKRKPRKARAVALAMPRDSDSLNTAGNVCPRRPFDSETELGQPMAILDRSGEVRKPLYWGLL